MAKFKMHILVCGGTGCTASKSQEIADRLKSNLLDKGLENEVQVILTGCFGFCEKGPIVKISPDHTFYIKIKKFDAYDENKNG